MQKRCTGVIMHINKLIWTCHWVCQGRRIETRSASFAEAVGTINRPLQAFYPLLRCPGYFVNVHNHTRTNHARLPPSLTILPHIVAEKYCSSLTSSNLEQILKVFTCVSHLYDLEYECHLNRLLNDQFDSLFGFASPFLLPQQSGVGRSETVPPRSVVSSAFPSCLLAHVGWHLALHPAFQGFAALE